MKYELILGSFFGILIRVQNTWTIYKNELKRRDLYKNKQTIKIYKTWMYWLKFPRNRAEFK